jgi:DNA-binding NarL/FixJ family response regulator
MPETPRSPIRVLLAAAHDATLAGLRMALHAGPFTVVAEVTDPGAAVEAAERERPDVCLVDEDMAGDPIAMTAEIARLVPSAGIVVLAAERSAAAMLDAVRAGAVGYLPKDMDPDRLRYAVQGVAQGEAAIPRALMTRLITEFRMRERGLRLPAGDGGEAELTSREWDVLSLLSEGASTRAMAERLGIADVTVRRHIGAVLAKLQVADRAAAAQVLRTARGR